MRRILQRIDGDALDTDVGSRLAGRERAAGQEENDSDRPLPSLAVDGKTVRSARRTDGTQVHLLAPMTGTGLVTAQREVDGKTHETTLHRWLKALPWREVPLLDRTRATAHGRDEIRRIKAAAVTKIAFPHAVQAVQIVRRRRIVTTGKVAPERVYGVTEQTPRSSRVSACEKRHAMRGKPDASQRRYRETRPSRM
ncbi:hypothetical protein [Streptomyces sp. 4N124]|uniref:hypothetical protein n=1 Tax=Streptomyces sp. 4N124 TaxID=3457420 RepID=UPI003FCF8B8D